jgi:hypothetical protein
MLPAKDSLLSHVHKLRLTRRRPTRSWWFALLLGFSVAGALSCNNAPIALDSGVATSGDGAIDAPGTGGSSAPAADARVDRAREQLGDNGSTCSVSDDCVSGHCFDGVCCEQDCSSACHSCAVPGAVGTCLLAEVGTDPRDDCQDQGSPSCGTDGTCDGNGSCRKYPTGIVCKQPSCSGSILTLAFRCAAGACAPTSGQPCDPFMCGTAASCSNTCTKDQDCTPPNACTNGSCGKRPLGGACDVADDCNSGLCQQKVCCSTTCAGTCQSCALPGSEGACTNVPERQDPLNQCNDTGVASCGTDGACDGAGACHLYPRGTTCRASAGICDVAETCAGAGAPCPADAFLTGNVCRASAGACDLPETCSGASATCPSDVVAPSATVCRPLSGICDVAETCTGSSVACPPDGVAVAGTVCRAAAGGCDIAEACTGTGTACPADRLMPAATVCRGAAGGCDAPEICSGVDPACPTDGFLAAGTVCRGAAGTCDTVETCSGLGTVCPADVFLPAGAPCRPSAGACDIAEACAGGVAACPPDGFLPPGTTCRPATGICDVAEACGGSSAACPTDTFVTAGSPCRPSAGLCDVVEACTGAAGACPPDGFAGPGTICRGAAGMCDAAESCTGGGAACPPDLLAPAGTTCRPAAELCDVAESCNGTTPACPPDSVAPAGTVCRGALGACDVAESCDGATAACPTDVLAAVGTVCRNSTTACDIAETCLGGDVSCPVDTGVVALTAPTGLSFLPLNGQAFLTWNTVLGATGFNVKRSTTSGGPYTLVGSTAARTFTSTGLTNGTTYFFVVSATAGGSGCESANSAQVAVTPVFCPGVFCDNFETDVAGTMAVGWTRVGGSAGDWSVVNQGTQFFAQNGATSLTPRAVFASSASGAPWSGAISISADVELLAVGVNSPAAAMVCARFVDLNNYYCLALSPTGVQIQTKVNGTVANGALSSQAINLGSIQQVKLSLTAGGVLSATLNSSVRSTFMPPALANGFAAVMTTSMEAEFDSIVVTQP